MSKSFLASVALTSMLAVPGVAAAQSAPAGGVPCAPGSWFCTQAPRLPPPPPAPVRPVPQPTESLETLPPPADAPDPEPPPAPPVTRRPRRPPPPIVVYEPPPPPPVALERPGPPPYEYYHPRRQSVSPPHEWGLNLHFEGAMIGNGAQGNAGLGGVGAGLRFKPTRSFGIEGDLDFVGGTDYQGDKRDETAFTLNALLFLNPQSHAQIYLLAGIGWSGAHVTCDSCATPIDNHYDYFGGQAGGGLELRLTRVLAFNIDIRGFIRGRTDSLAQTQPEFDSPAGCSSNPSATGTCRTTNSSGGALMTGGMTLYF
ncbi:MAG: outer membrane beta-barrel protein [Polyangiaceae bacterium]